MYETVLLIRVTYETLAEFLSSHEGVLWNIDSPDPTESTYITPVSAELIMEQIEKYRYLYDDGDEHEHLYVFSPELDPLSIVNTVKIDSAPIIDDPNRLHVYAKLSTTGHDYMYFARSPIEASNGEYVNLMIFDASEYEEEPE